MLYRLLLLWASLAILVGNGLHAQDVSSPSNRQLADGAKEQTTTEIAFTKPSNAQQGKHLLNAYCSRCHGKDGRGGKGPDLTDGVFRHVTSDKDILSAIVDGIPGTGMPGFGEGYDELLQPIIAYMRAEGKNRAKESQPPAGDVARGYELFKKHKCATCHWTGSEGGRLGTDLSRLAATVDYIRKSLTDPDSQIDASYQLVQIAMEDGRLLGGRRLHENTYFILLMDEKETYHTIPKTQIDELARPHKSLIPGFTKELNANDVEDLTAYIFSLQQESPK